MFWSHDLLKTKSALGAVWIAAHGKKLNKGRIMQVNVTEACKKVMDPEVPQALRLQAILVGGIVIVHARQQVYLLEDAQEMLRRLRALDAAGGEGADASGPKAVLGEGKRAAREEAITLPLTGDMQLLNLGELFPQFPTQAISEGGSGASQLGEGLFVMPSMPDGPEASSGGAPPAQQRKGQRGAVAAASGDASGGRAGGSGAGRDRGRGGLLLGQEEGDLDVELNVAGLPRHDLDLMDGPETFMVPDLDLPGMEFLGGGGPALSGGAPEPPYADADLFPVPSGLGEGRLPLEEGEVNPQPHAPGSQTPQVSSERADGSKGAAPVTKRKGKGRGRRGKATVDDIDTLQIRGKEYREWMADHSDLLVHRPQRAITAPMPAGGGAQAAPAGAKSALAVGPATAASMPGGAWPAELMELFMRSATLPSTAGRPRTKKSKGESGDYVEDQERYLDEVAAAAGGRGGRGGTSEGEHPEAALGPGDHGGFAGMDGHGFGDYGYAGEPPLGEEGGLGGYGGEDPYGAGGSGDNPFQRRTAAAARAAASGGSQEEEDVETERLRAALNSMQDGPGGEAFFPMGLTPGSAPGSLLEGASLGGRGGRAGKRASSQLLRRDSESGLASEKSSERRSAGRLSDLLEGGEGGGDLGAMLPAVGEDELYLEGEEGEAGGSRKRRRTADEGFTGTGTGPTGLTQFELLEASGPTQAVGGGLPGAPMGDNLNRQTLAFISIMRGRFDAAESQEGEGAGASQEGGCQLSLFDMADRLSRMDAAKLFYQVLVTRSHGFLEAEQQEPFGDILLSRGEYL